MPKRKVNEQAIYDWIVRYNLPSAIEISVTFGISRVQATKYRNEIKRRIIKNKKVT